jgi:hypothetical protein
MWYLPLYSSSSQPRAAHKARIQPIYLTWSSAKAKTGGTTGLPLTAPLLNRASGCQLAPLFRAGLGKGEKEPGDAGYRAHQRSL